MPVKHENGKYYVNNEEFDTEDKANAAYMAYLDKALGVSTQEEKPVKKSKKKLDTKS